MLSLIWLKYRIHDRSIVIPLKRKLTHEKSERLYRTNYDFDLIKRKLARFAIDHAEAIKKTIPQSLDHISDRTADNWESLLSIATLAGQEWQSKAIKAVTALDSSKDSKTYGVTLLTDIKEIFEHKNISKIFSSDLITELCQDKEKPWATFKQGTSIDQRILANLLKEFSITSRSIRLGIQVLKGYELEQFSDSFSRYIPFLPETSVTPLQMAKTAGYKHVSVSLQNILENLSDTLQTMDINDCNAVTAKTPKTDVADEYLLEERAAIMEYDGGLNREEAEMLVWGESDHQRPCICILIKLIIQTLCFWINKQSLHLK